MEKYTYRPVRFYVITFACTWFWWLFAILFNEGTSLYLGMFLGLISPAVVAVTTVLTSKNKALINDFKKKLVGFYRIKPIYIVIAVLIFAAIVASSIGTSVCCWSVPQLVQGVHYIWLYLVIMACAIILNTGNISVWT